MLTTRLGGLTGRITRGDGRLLVGATVVASNGIETFRTTSSGRGGALPGGGYLIPGLSPGWYSVTATLPGHRQRTALVRVGPGTPTSRDLALRKGD
ncbi:carboxypeptidase-like regulatory domain-containing protein [Nocardioides sp. TF02-7]|uniref:carboxypeptidase-like regulatory domain-containing protein n=1 Tax=Nocardioides sp. TF02-7 TaxID=2917724 RepID=UPI001F05F945|nr:carboxypeptidase-like regulatory domain-containing protein [Nocardioides sp. TF02-7]UMG91031.1 carboxypeptidase-like regulatory domain-containing protein [Nocardioides sp. TF02-7]